MAVIFVDVVTGVFFCNTVLEHLVPLFRFYFAASSVKAKTRLCSRFNLNPTGVFDDPPIATSDPTEIGHGVFGVIRALLT